MRSEILQANAAREFETAERCHISEVANDDGDDRVSIARARVEPGVTTAWHSLDGVSERYIIVSGRGRAEIGDLGPVDVEAGDVVRIAPGVAQRISNCGATDLVFYAVCSPPFSSGCYRNLE